MSVWTAVTETGPRVTETLGGEAVDKEDYRVSPRDTPAGVGVERTMLRSPHSSVTVL